MHDILITIAIFMTWQLGAGEDEVDLLVKSSQVNPPS
jgi:hypothetical protein